MTAESQLPMSPTVIYRSLPTSGPHSSWTAPSSLPSHTSSCRSFPNLTLAVATSYSSFYHEYPMLWPSAANFLLFLPTKSNHPATTWKACSNLLPVSSLASTPTPTPSAHLFPWFTSVISHVWAAWSIPKPQRTPRVFSLLPTVPETRGAH